MVAVQHFHAQGSRFLMFLWNPVCEKMLAVARSVARPVARPVAQPVARSVARSVACSVARLVARPVARSVARLLYSIFTLRVRDF